MNFVERVMRVMTHFHIASRGPTSEARRCVFDPTGRLRLAVRHAQDAAPVAADITRLLKENP